MSRIEQDTGLKTLGKVVRPDGGPQVCAVSANVNVVKRSGVRDSATFAELRHDHLTLTADSFLVLVT